MHKKNKSAIKISNLFESFPQEWVNELPPSFHKISSTSNAPIIVEKSKIYNTDQLACFWFYKPITQLYKVYKDE